MLINPNTNKPMSSAQKEVEVLNVDQIRDFVRFEDMLKAMQLGLICGHCTKLFGPPLDGVQGWESDDGSELHLTCGHKDRIFRMAPGSTRQM